MAKSEMGNFKDVAPQIIGRDAFWEGLMTILGIPKSYDPYKLEYDPHNGNI